jgi:uncharacterized coiled-coil protein SlyX
MSDAPETRINNLREAHAWIGAAQARIDELEAQLARAEGTLDEARMACSDRAERLDNFSPEFECCAATARNCESDIDALIALEKKP